MDQLKSDWKASAPFVFCEVDGLGNSGTVIMDSFTKYAVALEECVLTKLPQVLIKGNRVLEEADDVRKYSEA
jgi:hypothetical protein